MKIIEFQRILYWQRYNEISNAALRAQKVVDLYNKIEAFKNLSEKDWIEFSQDPQGYYEAQIQKVKTKRFKNDPIDEEVFKRLYKIPDLTIPYIPEVYYLTMRDGVVTTNEKALEELKEDFIIKTDDPELIKKLENIENFVKQYDELYFELFGNSNRAHNFLEIGYSRTTKQFNYEIVSQFVK